MHHDLRYAVRALLRRPGFALAVVLTLALGIGANTAIFSVLEAVVLRPLPFPGSERVVQLWETNERMGDHKVASPPNVADWDHLSTTIEDFGLARGWPFTVRAQDETVPVRGAIATPGWFEVHAVSALHGRVLAAGDLEQGGRRVVVLSHAFWQARFGGDPTAVGSSLVVDGETYEVVGVLPADAWLVAFGDADLWTPITAIPDDTTDRGWRGFMAIGRLAKNVPLAAARAELESVSAALVEQYPETNQEWGVRVENLRSVVSGSVGATLWVLLGCVGFVLLIGCSNVANLVLARATDRRQELAVRSSLGAGRARLVRQMLAESVVLSLVGAGVGLLVAQWAMRAFLTLAPPGLPRLGEVAINGTVLAFTAGTAVMTALLVGLPAAVHATRTGMFTALRSGCTSAPTGARTRRLLVGAEVALAFVLLVGAGLMLRGFSTLLRWDPGFDRDHLVTMWAFAGDDAYPGGDAVNELFEQAATQLTTIGGVTSVGMTSAGPLFGGVETDELEIPGRPGSHRASARWYDVGPGYFESMGMPLVRGRDIRPSDRRDTRQVAVVNETMARRFWPGSDAVGRTFAMQGRTIEVVGVVRDVRPLRADLAPQAEVYWPKRQAPRRATFFVLRTVQPADEADLALIEREARARLGRLAPDLMVSGLRSVSELERRNLVAPRFFTLLMNAFALLAAGLACVGVYGVIAYVVASRRRELAIRMALGARPSRLTRDVVAGGLSMLVPGVAAGLLAALLLGRLLTAHLYGVSPVDPLVLVGVPVMFLPVALLACGLPARRAARLDPVRVLRSE